MRDNLYLYILLAIIFSIFISGFQYLYKNKDKSIIKKILFVIRAISIFLILLLFINPKIVKIEFEIIKPKLIILTDNSKSISKLNQKQDVINIVNKIKFNKELDKKFNLELYSFSDMISINDSLDFSKNSTNIFKSLNDINKIYKKDIAPIILITDGNQTVGKDFSNIKINQSIYPIIVGDTTIFSDIFISQLNVNKYTYLKNKFPVEAFVNYEGEENVSSKLTIRENNKIVFTKNISFDKTNKFKKVNLFIDANKIGIHNYIASLQSIKNEKNKFNNKKSFTVEVLSEQSKIAIISDIKHPDVAMFKRSIESNKQRKIFILDPKANINLNDYQLIILYQPNVKFKNIVKNINKLNKNFIIVTGKQTNWNFLNKAQSFFNKKSIQKTEDYLAFFNTSYSTFITRELSFDNFQPLTDYFGNISFLVPHQNILFQKIGNINSKQPLLTTFEKDNRRGAVLFGENIWRWRMSSKIEKKSFQPFDEFINNLVQYLSSNKKANFLEISSKSNFYQNETIKISANSFDANYNFDPNAKLWVEIYNKNTKAQFKYPFALNKNKYEVHISDLDKGNYSFLVFNELNKSKIKGRFNVLDYNIEDQFINSNKIKLGKLADSNKTKLYYLNNIEELILNLENDNKYKSIQKSKDVITPLIKWKWILGIILLLLSIEWFIRKYKGYI